ncbi:MAG: hypothetical protein AB7F29_07550 [Candidatus Nitrosocosmicus sp.]
MTIYYSNYSTSIFSVTSISFSPTKDILGWKSNPFVTFSTMILTSFMVGPLGDEGAFAYAP